MGNPPFLGGKWLRRVLGDGYVSALFRVYEGRVPREADLVTYWQDKARAQVEAHRLKRAGLLATQAIRAGANRQVMERIKKTRDVFFAHADEPCCSLAPRSMLVRDRACLWGHRFRAKRTSRT